LSKQKQGLVFPCMEWSPADPPEPFVYLDAAAASVLAPGPGGPAEGGPTVLLAPRQRVVLVPPGAVGADAVQVPAVLRRVVQVVRGAHVGRGLRRRHGREGAEEGGHR
jgi:hypothetical protein